MFYVCLGSFFLYLLGFFFVFFQVVDFVYVCLGSFFLHLLGFFFVFFQVEVPKSWTEQDCGEILKEVPANQVAVLIVVRLSMVVVVMVVGMVMVVMVVVIVVVMVLLASSC